MPNYYTHERLAQAHRLDLLREAEHERLLAKLPQPRYDLLLLSRLLPPGMPSGRDCRNAYCGASPEQGEQSCSFCVFAQPPCSLCTAGSY